MSENKINLTQKDNNTLNKYIDLLNSLIFSLKNKPLNDIEELSDESTIYSLILEIEPNFEKIPFNNKVEIIKDQNTEIRYNNFISIFNSVENYKNESKSKDKFTKETNFTKSISINDLLNNEQEQLLKIGEMLCFLTIISSNKNYYIEKVNEIENNQISNLYYSIIEKYIVFKIDESISSVVEKTNVFSNQVQNIKAYNLKIDNDKNKLIGELDIDSPHLDNNQEIKIINPTKTIIISQYDDFMNEKEEEQNIGIIDNNENFEREKEKILMQIKIDNFVKELSEMKEKNQILENDKKKLEEDINKLNEINNDLIKNNIDKNNKSQSENKDDNLNEIVLEDKNLVNNINKELNEANQIIETLKNDNIKLSENIEQINKEKENLTIKLNNSNSELNKILLENEKLKNEYKAQEIKYEEIILKNKNEIEKLKEELNSQKIINEKIKKEKETMQYEIEKYKNEINKNINNQNKDINNNNINNNENNKKNNSNENELKNEIQKLKNNLIEKEEKIKKLEEINIEKEKDKGEDINFYKKSYEEQKNRVNEEHKLISESLYKLAIHFMTLKDDLQKRINSSNNDK